MAFVGGCVCEADWRGDVCDGSSCGIHSLCFPCVIVVFDKTTQHAVDVSEQIGLSVLPRGVGIGKKREVVTQLCLVACVMVRMVVAYLVGVCCDTFVDVVLLGVSFDPSDASIVGTLALEKLADDLPQISITVEAPWLLGWLGGCLYAVEFPNKGCAVRENVYGSKECEDICGYFGSCTRAVVTCEDASDGNALKRGGVFGERQLAGGDRLEN